jgi:hypothetical protein
MEQLRSLTWGYDTTALGLPLSDTTSNLSVDPPDNAGNGLNPSPGTALTQPMPGYTDYLDANGAWVGNGGAPPARAKYVRRWSVDPLPTNPNNTLVLRVLARTIEQDAIARNNGLARAAGETLLVSVKTRKAQ